MKWEQDQKHKHANTKQIGQDQKHKDTNTNGTGRGIAHNKNCSDRTQSISGQMYNVNVTLGGNWAYTAGTSSKPKKCLSQVVNGRIA